MPPIGGWPSGVYRFRNVVNGKVYVGSSKNLLARRGQHVKDLQNGVHCNIHFQRAWDKYGSASFVFEIVERCPGSRLIEREQHWLDFYRAAEREFGYNISTVAGKNSFSQETREKLSKSCMGRVVSPEARAKISAAGMGRTHVVSPEGRARMSEIAKARPPMREETRQKIGEIGRGRRHTEEARAKISVANTGHGVSEETRAKISEANKGRVHTQEHRKKNSDFQKQRYQSEEEREKTRRATSEAIMASEEMRANRARAGRLSWIKRRLRKIQEQG